MIDVLLLSEDNLKTHSALPDNIWGKDITPAIFDAQNIYLQGILGSSLYNSILDKVDNETITASTESNYKTLLDDYITPYLINQTICCLIPIIGSKITNLGTVISNDEHLVNLTQAEREDLANTYKYKADFYTKFIQKYLIDNVLLFPELLEENQVIAPNLESSTSSPIWTGGYIKPVRRGLRRRLTGYESE